MESQEMKGIRESDLAVKTGRSRSSSRRDVARGLLPPPIKWGTTSIWLEHEVDVVIAARAAGLPEANIRSIVEELISRRADALHCAETRGEEHRAPKRMTCDGSR